MADPETPDPNETEPASDVVADQEGDAKTATETATDEASAEASAGRSNSTAESSTAEIEERLDQAAESLDQAAGQGVSTSNEAQPYNLGDLSPPDDALEKQPIDLVGEVEMDLRIELGRTQMRLEEVLHLRGGSVVALDKLAGDPVDVFANGKLIARGEVLVMNDNFCIRVTELVGV